MKPGIFVDTSSWIAVSDRGEANHTKAVHIFRQLMNRRGLLVTTNLVIAEAHILLRRRLGQSAAMAFLDSLHQSAHVEIVYPGMEHELEAIRILKQFQDQDFSLTDAISFAVMRKSKITEAFSFDHHFVIAGFNILE